MKTDDTPKGRCPAFGCWHVLVYRQSQYILLQIQRKRVPLWTKIQLSLHYLYKCEKLLKFAKNSDAFLVVSVEGVASFEAKENGAAAAAVRDGAA